MVKQLKVSIIVPVYNAEKYLVRCLDSLVNQTLKEIEIICINDGSIDDSLKILNEYAAKYHNIIVINQKNQGQSAARNVGIDTAGGEFIAFIDADDWVDLDYFEKLYISAVKNNCDIAVSGMIRLHKYHKKFHLKFEVEKVTEDVNEKFELCDVPELSYTCNKIYKKESFIKYNLKFEEGRLFEDLILTPKILFYLGKMVTVPDTYYYYWRHSKSTVAVKTEKRRNDMLYARQKAKDFIQEHNIDISSHEPVTKRYKLFGFTVFKVRKKGNKKIKYLFNIVKW